MDDMTVVVYSREKYTEDCRRLGGVKGEGEERAGLFHICLGITAAGCAGVDCYSHYDGSQIPFPAWGHPRRHFSL